MQVRSHLAALTAATIVVSLTSPRLAAQVINGDFSAGFAGFTSDYTFAPSATQEGFFGVRTSPKLFNTNYDAFGDHTTGTDNMMIINGATIANQTVWTETVNVVPGADYIFSGWVASAFPSNSAQIQMSVNGTPLGAAVVAPAQSGIWAGFTRTWNAGASTTAVLRIVDQNIDPSGNDFALDDLRFAPVPEPSSLVLIGAAAAIGCWRVGRTRRPRAQVAASCH